jgi:hypothetical protein
VKIAKRGACGAEFHACRLARRVQPLLIVIGTDTAHMPARGHPGYDAASQNCKEENASRFQRMSVIGKSRRDADIAFR